MKDLQAFSLIVLASLSSLGDPASSAPPPGQGGCSQQITVGQEKMWVTDVLTNHKCQMESLFVTIMGRATPASAFAKMLGSNPATEVICAGMLGILDYAEKQAKMSAMCASLPNEWDGVFCKEYFGGGTTTEVLKNVIAYRKSNYVPLEVASAIDALASMDLLTCYEACGGGKGAICKAFVRTFVAMLGESIPPAAKNDGVGEAPEEGDQNDGQTGNEEGDEKDLPGAADDDSQEGQQPPQINSLQETDEAGAPKDLGQGFAGDKHLSDSSLSRFLKKPPSEIGKVPGTGGQGGDDAREPPTLFGLPQTNLGQPQTGLGQPKTAFGQPQTHPRRPQTGLGPLKNGFGQPQPDLEQPQTGSTQPQTGSTQPQTGFTQPQTGGQPQIGFKPPGSVQPQTGGEPHTDRRLEIGSKSPDRFGQALTGVNRSEAGGDRPQTSARQPQTGDDLGMPKAGARPPQPSEEKPRPSSGQPQAITGPDEEKPQPSSARPQAGTRQHEGEVVQPTDKKAGLKEGARMGPIKTVKPDDTEMEVDDQESNDDLLPDDDGSDKHEAPLDNDEALDILDKTRDGDEEEEDEWEKKEKESRPKFENLRPADSKTESSKTPEKKPPADDRKPVVDIPPVQKFPYSSKKNDPAPPPPGPPHNPEPNHPPQPVIKSVDYDVHIDEEYEGHGPFFFLTIITVVVILGAICYCCISNKLRVREMFHILLTSRGRKARKEYR